MQRTAVANGCASVPNGNALTPLPVPRYTATLGSRTRGGFNATLRTHGGTVLDAVVTLTRGARRVQTVRLARLRSTPSTFVLKLARPGSHILNSHRRPWRLYSRASRSTSVSGMPQNSQQHREDRAVQ